jgi:diaminopropionate ammonia-lyase
MSGPLYSNPAAHFWSSTSTTDPSLARFHHSLPGYAPTRTFPLHSIAKELGVGHFLLKDESNRLGLPAFKILGASWATFRALSENLALPVDTPLEDLGVAARRESVRLLAATNGNHGRAVARMAALLGIDCFIFVPRNVDEAAQSAIASEGAKVVVVDGDYDQAVLKAKSEADFVPLPL